MDPNSIVEIVKSVGFPILACGALFWLINDMRKSHKAEMDKMSEALNNNTTALTRLMDKLNGGGNNE